MGRMRVKLDGFMSSNIAIGHGEDIATMLCCIAHTCFETHAPDILDTPENNFFLFFYYFNDL